MARRIRPVDRLESIVERLDEALDERDVDADIPRTGVLNAVDVDIVDDGDDVVVVSDLPGFDREDISVEADSHRLRLSAEVEEEEEEGDEEYYRKERSRRSLSRTVTLPVEVDASEADASYENGVLSVRLPKEGIEGGEEIEIS